MDILKEFSFDELELSLKDKEYDLVYINYDVEDGIKACKSIYDLSKKEKKDFYRMIVFNDDFMVTIYKISDDEYRYNKVEKANFEEGKSTIKSVYLTDKFSNIGKKLIIRSGKLKNLDETSFQFIGFEGGEK